MPRADIATVPLAHPFPPAASVTATTRWLAAPALMWRASAGALDVVWIGDRSTYSPAKQKVWIGRGRVSVRGRTVVVPIWPAMRAAGFAIVHEWLLAIVRGVPP